VTLQAESLVRIHADQPPLHQRQRILGSGSSYPVEMETAAHPPCPTAPRYSPSHPRGTTHADLRTTAHRPRRRDSPRRRHAGPSSVSHCAEVLSIPSTRHNTCGSPDYSPLPSAAGFTSTPARGPEFRVPLRRGALHPIHAAQHVRIPNSSPTPSTARCTSTPARAVEFSVSDPKRRRRPFGSRTLDIDQFSLYIRPCFEAY
jgi:hypothetical protein